MTNKEMFMALTGNGVPKGAVKDKMFEFHNSRFGKSQFVKKIENPKIGCGVCIQRVKAAVWKIYHTEYKLKYTDLYFTDRLGLYNMPVYKIKK